jgi:hypothetical protein
MPAYCGARRAMRSGAGDPTLALNMDFATNGSFLDRKSGSSSLVTFTRASDGTYFDSAGLLQTAATDVARFNYNPLTLAARGLLFEAETRTNVVLWNRDLTNVAWTSTNITAVKDQTGIDGVANSASSITATAGNGTCLQAITLASSARFQSAYVKRLVGSGVVNMTTDNGSTWTAVTVTAGWTRVTIPTQTLANPTVGFRLVTSGDSIAVDFVQNENGAFATSAIPVTTVAVTRAADTAVISGASFSSWFNASAGTFIVRLDTASTTPSFQNPVGANDGGTTERLQFFIATSNPSFSVVDQNITGASLDMGTIVANTATTLGASYALNDIAACQDGGAVLTDVSSGLPTVDRLTFGTAGGSPFTGHFASLKFYQSAKSDAELQTLTT